MHFTSTDNDILDWGKKDLLLAALNRQIFMWHTPSNNVLTLHDFGEDSILVTKFDPTGTYIAVFHFIKKITDYDIDTLNGHKISCIKPMI